MESFRRDGEFVRDYLKGRTIGCPSCGYNLRDLPGESCPECGLRLQITLNGGQANIGPWMVRVLAIALPLGFVGIFAMTALFGAWRSWAWNPQDWYTVGAAGIVCVVYSIGLIAVVRARHRFLERPRREQWMRAFALSGIMAVIQVALMYWWSRSSY